MPSKVLNTKPTKPRKLKAPVKAAKAPPTKAKRSGDPWLRNDRSEVVAEERGGKNWLPKEKSRDWLKGR
jgi:hypothetical protein